MADSEKVVQTESSKSSRRRTRGLEIWRGNKEMGKSNQNKKTARSSNETSLDEKPRKTLVTNQPRKHHYVPKFYLAGFTASGSKDDYLYVLDQTVPKQFRAKPSKLAHQRDFYVIETHDEQERIAIEKLFGKVEDLAAPVIKQITINNRLPSINDMIKLLHFVALMAMRVPAAIYTLNLPFEIACKMKLRQIVQNRKVWDNIIAQVKAKGQQIEDVPYEQMKVFIESDSCKITTSQNGKIHSILLSIVIILPLLLQRTWSLLISKEKDANFICSDRPVSLEWTTQMSDFYIPGFGMKNTQIMVPLNKEVAIIGNFGGKPQLAQGSQKDLAIINSQTARNARFLFSSQQDFIWYKKDGTIGRIKDVFEAIEQEKDSNLAQ